VGHEKILMIQTAFLGDVILSTPVVRALKKVFPDSRLDVLTIPATRSIFQHNPFVNKIIEFDKKPLVKKLGSFVGVLAALKTTNYDLAFSLQSSLTSSFLMMLAGISERVGFKFQKFLTIPVSHEKGLPIRERYLSLLRPFSNQKFDNQTELFWTEKEEQTATKFFTELAAKGQYVLGIAPGSVWQTKMWLPEYYVSLLKLLSQQGNIAVVLLGGGAEKQLCDDIIEAAQTNAVNVAGKLSVLESAALINKLDLMLTNDSAPMHIANAVKTDVIAIFGPTVKRFGCYPYRENDVMLEIDLYCRPCSKHGGKSCPEGHFRCMREIKPETVFEVIMSKLG